VQGHASQSARDVLTDIAMLGPFFSVQAHLPGEHPHPPWLPVGALASRPEPMRRRISAVRHALAADAGSRAEQIEVRVAASAAHFGMVARLVSPTLAALAFGYQLGTDPSELWWQDVLGGPYPLSVPVPVHDPDSRSRAAETACRQLIAEVIEPVTSVVTELVPMSTRVLWGNVASAVNSASMLIAARKPEAADTAQRTAEILFRTPQLRTERSQPGPGFRRSSCCLFYRLSAEKSKSTCDDCVLSESPS
jgi:FhuF 2Fe-2S C-terminal domain